MASRSIALLIAVSSALSAQSFDVASIRVVKAPVQAYRIFDEGPPPPPAPPEITVTPVRLTMRNINLGSCVKWAWDLRNVQIADFRPLSRTYDIVANPGRPTATEDMRLMLRNLLTERLQLRVHFEKKDAQIAELVPARGGLKLSESAPGTPASHQFTTAKDGRRIDIWKGTTLDKLVSMLEFHMMGPVADKTALTGRYDFTLIWPDITHGSPGDFYMAWREAIERQLGLTTRLGRGLLDVMILDHANDLPIAN